MERSIREIVTGNSLAANHGSLDAGSRSAGYTKIQVGPFDEDPIEQTTRNLRSAARGLVPVPVGSSGLLVPSVPTVPAVLFFRLVS